jgi:hypothetical protein
VRHENEIYICRGSMSLAGIARFLPLDKILGKAFPEWKSG